MCKQFWAWVPMKESRIASTNGNGIAVPAEAGEPPPGPSEPWAEAHWWQVEGRPRTWAREGSSSVVCTETRGSSTVVCCWCGLEVKLNLLSPEASLDKSFGSLSLWPDPLLWFPSSASICGSHVTDGHCRPLVAQNWTTSLYSKLNYNPLCLQSACICLCLFVCFKIQLSMHDTVKVIFSLLKKKTIKIVSSLYWHSAFWNKLIEEPFSATEGLGMGSS